MRKRRLVVQNHGYERYVLYWECRDSGDRELAAPGIVFTRARDAVAYGMRQRWGLAITIKRKSQENLGE